MKTYKKHGIIVPELLKKYKNIVPIGNAIDIGCAGGAVTLYLSSLGFNCTGIDIELAENLKTNKDIKFIEQNIFDFNFSKNFYSLITSYNVLHYFSRKEKYNLLDRILSSVSSNGYLFITSFTTKDGGYTRKQEMGFEEVELNTLYDKEKKKTSSYFSKNELKKWAIDKELNMVYYEENIVNDNHSPLGIHQHGIVELICKKL